MKFILIFEMDEHSCIECPLNHGSDCPMQRDDIGDYKYFHTYNDQMKNCPLHIYKEEKNNENELGFRF